MTRFVTEYGDEEDYFFDDIKVVRTLAPVSAADVAAVLPAGLAAEGLDMSVTPGKTLTLTAADNYNLTVPASGTAFVQTAVTVAAFRQTLTITSDTGADLYLKRGGDEVFNIQAFDASLPVSMRIPTAGLNFTTGLTSSFSNELAYGGTPPDSFGELVIKTGATGIGNVVAVQNTDNTKYSTYTARSTAGKEKIAFGYGNLYAGYWADKVYIEIWPGDGSSPIPEFTINHDGNYGPIGSGMRFYKRISLAAVTSNFDIWTLTPIGTTPVSAVHVDAITGKVGLGGTVVPAETLDVIGRIKISNDNTGNSFGWIYGDDTNHSIILRGDRTGAHLDCMNFYGYGGTLASGDKGFRFWTGGVLANQTEKMRIANDGIYMGVALVLGTLAGSGDRAVMAHSDGTLYC